MYLSAPAAPSVPPTPRPTREAWESVDPDVLTTLSDEITSLSAHVYAETHRLLRLIAEFDRLEGWKRAGFANCAEWLAYSTRIDKMTAREKVRVARALARLPETSAAMARGELSFSQARAITRVADPDSEAELLGHASEMSAAALERLVRSWRRPGPSDEAAMEARRHASRCLSVFPDEDGSYLIRGRLDPEVGALLMRAIEAASDALYRGSVPETTPEQRRADALGLLAERAFGARFGETAGGDAAGDAGDDAGDGAGRGAGDDAARGAPAERYMVVLHVDDGADGGATLEDGTRVSAETSRRLACDASVVRARGSEAGRREHPAARTRVVPPRMRRALQLRDRGCRFPGCGSRFTEAHHVRHWADGGRTELENLVLLCRVHHRLLHEGGFRLEVNPKRPGRPDFVSPRGVRIPETPPPMKLGGQRAEGCRVGGPRVEGAESRWEEDVPLALYLKAMAGTG